MQAAPEKNEARTEIKPNREEKKPESKTAASEEPKHYGKWARVVSGIEGVKPSIASPLSKAVALVNSDGSFLVKIDAFFVKIIGESRENMSIIKGLIAECENKSPEEISISVVPKASSDVATLADEIARALS